MEARVARAGPTSSSRTRGRTRPSSAGSTRRCAPGARTCGSTGRTSRPTADWRARIFAGIEASRTFLAVLSPELLASEVCAEELAHATASNKRGRAGAAPRDRPRRAPDELLAPNWIFFRDGDDFERRGGAARRRARDRPRLARRARTPARCARPSGSARAATASFLLRGSDLRDAESWLAEQGSHREAATPLQAEYVVASRRGAAGRQRALFAGVTVALAVAVVLGVVALLSRNDAIEQSHLSRSRELAAKAVRRLGTDPELGLLLAREAPASAPRRRPRTPCCARCVRRISGSDRRRRGRR